MKNEMIVVVVKNMEKIMSVVVVLIVEVKFISNLEKIKRRNVCDVF
jgi:hypothetical protein